MKNAKLRMFLVLITTLALFSANGNEVLRTPMLKDPIDKYAQNLLVKALKTQGVEALPLETKGTDIEPRIIFAMQYGELDLAWIAAGKYKGKSADAIPVPIFANALSEYTLLTQSGSAVTISQPQQLANFTIGIQRYDPIGAGLSSNNLKFEQTRVSTQLISMLEGGRIDLIIVPRLRLEAEHGYKNTNIKTLTTRLYMPSEYYFYVSSKKPDLKNKLTAGLNKLNQTRGLTALLEETFYSFDKSSIAAQHKADSIQFENPHLSKPGFAQSDKTVSEIAMDNGE